jgi:hypothetical protein
VPRDHADGELLLEAQGDDEERHTRISGALKHFKGFSDAEKLISV